jgi:hypothetical protein
MYDMSSCTPAARELNFHSREPFYASSHQPKRRGVVHYRVAPLNVLAYREGEGLQCDFFLLLQVTTVLTSTPSVWKYKMF